MAFWEKKDHFMTAGLVFVFIIGLMAVFDSSKATSFWGSSSEPSHVAFVDENQRQITLDQFKGTPLIINFWATWCPSCVKKMGSVNSFAQKFQAHGGRVLAISQDQGGISKVRSFYARQGYKNLPIYIDSAGQLLKTFGVKGLPTTIFINAQGQEVDRIVGGFDLESPEAAAKIQNHFGMSM